MPETTENNTGQPRSRLKGMAKKTVKRLDFGMRRPAPKPASKPAPKPASAKPAPVKSVPARPAPKPTPVKPAPKPPVKNHGMFIDFAPTPVKSRPTTSATTSVASTPVRPHQATPVKPRPTTPARPRPAAPRPKPAVAPKIKPAPAPRPKPAPAPKPRPKPAPRPRPEPEPPLFNEEETALVSAFDEELEALEGISDDIFDDIDDNASNLSHVAAAGSLSALEDEFETEARDFVKEPKPLFEDPLVMLSKVRDEHRQKKEAKAAADLKEQVKKEAKKASYLAPYTLGGRSPFLTSVNVEKRPLSAPGSAAGVAGSMAARSAAKVANGPMTAAGSAKSAKSTKSAAKAASKLTSKFTSKTPKVRWTAKNSENSPVKLQAPGSVLMENTYRNQMKQQLDQDAKEIHRRTMMASAPEEKSRRPSLIIAIILTVLLGVGVGAVVYLIFFQ